MEVEPAAAASPLALAAAAAPFLPSAASAPAAADDDDEVDPLDAFMESNSVQLVKDDAQLQQQQEAEDGSEALPGRHPCRAPPGPGPARRAEAVPEAGGKPARRPGEGARAADEVKER